MVKTKNIPPIPAKKETKKITAKKPLVKKPVAKKPLRTKKVADKTDTNKRLMLQTLEKTLGIVTSACKIVGISRETHYKYLREDIQYNNAVKDLDEIAKDFVETQLHKQIGEGNVTSIIFYLKSKAKDRGYIERVENVNTNINHEVSLTPEQIKKMSNELDNQY